MNKTNLKKAEEMSFRYTKTSKKKSENFLDEPLAKFFFCMSPNIRGAKHVVMRRVYETIIYITII